MLYNDNAILHKFKSFLDILLIRKKLILSLSTFVMFLGFGATGYIYLDINPSIELA